jgi:Mg-chelatase subunit ChlD
MLRLFRNDSLISEREVHLMPSGTNAFVLPQRIDQKGFYTYSARIESLRSDVFAQNNSAEALVMVAGRPKTLYLYGDTQPSLALTRVLREANFDADVRSAGGLPSTIAGLHDFDLVILDNVPASAISKEQMSAVKAYVHDLGGGFIMIGGDKSFGAGGYYKTPIEDVLPVSLDIRNRKHFPTLALVIVIDRSGSMNERQLGRAKIQLAAEAASAAVDTLSERDSVGVIAFDDDAHPVVQITNAENKVPIHSAIEAITALGGTNMYPGIKMAYEWLLQNDAQLKHIIVLSDGESQPGNFRHIARSIRESGITLSTVAVGETADFTMMKMLADAGAGRYYEAGDPQSLSAIFTREAFLASGAAIMEEPFVPILKQSSQATSGIDWSRAPRLLGYAGVAEREPATEGVQPPATTALVSHKDDPVYAVWQYGLGRSAAFTSDLKPRWAAEWMNWSGLGQFATQMMRDVVRRSSPGGEYSIEPRVHFSETREGAQLGQLSVDALTIDGRYKNDLRLHARVVRPDLTSDEFNLGQTEAGHYETSFPAGARGAYLINLFDERGKSLAITGAVRNYSREFAIAPADLELLRRVAESAGGRLFSGAEASSTDASTSLFERRQPRSTSREIWRLLLVTAVLLLPIDVGLRRIYVTREDLHAAAESLFSRLDAVARTVFGSRSAAATEGHASVGRLKASRRRVRLRGEGGKPAQPSGLGSESFEPAARPESAIGGPPTAAEVRLESNESASGSVGPVNQGTLAAHLLRIKKKRE